jgi:DNA-binding GntR family transcriptional regulator
LQAPKFRSLKDHVYEYIAQKIQDGTLLPNQKINEAEICSKLGISRTPTREALFQLSSDNLLEYIPRRGFIVKPFDLKNKLDVFRIIGSLDALAASLAADHLKEADLEEMEKLLDKIEHDMERHDFSEYHKDQYRFHEMYIGKCDNPTLIEMLDSLKNSFIRQSYLSEDKQKLHQVLKEVNAEHRQSVDLLRKKDKEGLEALLKYHWRIIDTEMI